MHWRFFMHRYTGVIDIMAKITEDKIQEMIKLYNEGKTFAEISRIINVTSGTISKHLKSRGVPL